LAFEATLNEINEAVFEEKQLKLKINGKILIQF